MPISGPKSILSLKAGLRASGNGSASMMVPALISTLRKSSKVIGAGLSVGCVMGLCFARCPLFPECAEGAGEARAQGDWRFKPLHQRFTIPELAIERRHGAGEAGVIVLEPDAQHVGLDLGEAQSGDITLDPAQSDIGGC